MATSATVASHHTERKSVAKERFPIHLPALHEYLARRLHINLGLTRPELYRR